MPYPLTSGLLTGYAPQSATTGLLGTAQNYGYPITSGLLNSLSAPSGTPNYTQQALALAGNPHAGPYANAPGFAPIAGTSGAAASGLPSGPSTSSQVEGALLGVAKNAANPNSLIGKAVSNYLNPSTLSPAATAALGSAGNADVNSALSALGTQTAAQEAATGTQIGNSADAGLLAQMGSGLTGDAATAASMGITPLVASQLTPIGTGAADAAANAADASAAQELANAGYGSGGGAAGASGGSALGTAGRALGALGTAYSAYNMIKNWQSGNTGSDALNGAETGAGVGSMIVPGIGTVIGGLIGGAAGALSSAFGGGERDPETTNWNSLAGAYNNNPGVMSSLNPSQLYQGLAGVMDAKNNSPGHSEPIEQVYGREGEQNLMDAMTNYANQQYQAGNIKPSESVAEQWTNTIYPWLQSQGASINPNQRTSSGSPEGSALISDLQGLLGDWESGAINPQSQLGINGQPISGLMNFAGLSPAQLATIQQQSKPASVSAQALRRGSIRGLRP